MRALERTTRPSGASTIVATTALPSSSDHSAEVCSAGSGRPCAGRIVYLPWAKRALERAEVLDRPRLVRTASAVLEGRHSCAGQTGTETSLTGPLGSAR